MAHSVLKRRAATEAAFCRAERVTKASVDDAGLDHVGPLHLGGVEADALLLVLRAVRDDGAYRRSNDRAEAAGDDAFLNGRAGGAEGVLDLLLDLGDAVLDVLLLAGAVESLCFEFVVALSSPSALTCAEGHCMSHV